MEIRVIWGSTFLYRERGMKALASKRSSRSKLPSAQGQALAMTPQRAATPAKSQATLQTSKAYCLFSCCTALLLLFYCTVLYRTSLSFILVAVMFQRSASSSTAVRYTRCNDVIVKATKNMVVLGQHDLRVKSERSTAR